MALQEKMIIIVINTLFFVAYLHVCHSSASAAPANTGTLKAKQEAESKGYVFSANRDEIISRAKKEGQLRVLYGLFESLTQKTTTEAFKKKYPFIDLHVESIRGTDAGQRSLLEIKSGTAQNWDIVRTYTDFYSEYTPFLWKIDLLGMAEQRVLAIPPKMIDPKQRNAMAILSRFTVIAYNKNLVAERQVPKKWEDILAPEFKGRKFAVDIRPQELAALVPSWGLEKTLDFSRKLAAQQPIWVRGGTRTLVAMGAGEVPLFLGVNYGSVKRYQGKDPSGTVQYAILEPVPVRVSSEHAILAKCKNPYAALLWLEFIASEEAQRLIDEHEPLAGSVYVRGSIAEQELRGKQLSVASWEQNQGMEEWLAKMFEAFGFPKTGEAKR
jgi:iron(III) transport system substrate-binding protein